MFITQTDSSIAIIDAGIIFLQDEFDPSEVKIDISIRAVKLLRTRKVFESSFIVKPFTSDNCTVHENVSLER